jgi:SAM-dependent methyltransferase
VKALYNTLARWYPVLTPPDEYAHEAAWYRQVLEASTRPLASLLELGCGAGHNALHMKGGLDCVLTDIAPAMLAHSRRLNPECEHRLGDMRDLRLGRTFDAVFVHDAVTYMLTRADLRAAVETAAAHLRPGGVVLLAPDETAETFAEQTTLFERSRGAQAMRCVEWSWDPDPNDEQTVTEYIFALREQGEVRVVHDHHSHGLFSEEVWVSTLKQAGFVVTVRDMEVEGARYPRFVGVLGGATP